MNIVISFSMNSALVNFLRMGPGEATRPSVLKTAFLRRRSEGEERRSITLLFPPPPLVISRPKRTVPDFQGRTEEAQINRQDVFRRGQLPQIEEIFYRPWQGKKVDRNPPQALQFMRGNGADGIFLKRDLNERICGRN